MREFEPIFDFRKKEIIGYEVLYRGVENREAFFDLCTEEEDLNIFLESLEFIKERRQNGKLYFVNVFATTVLKYPHVVSKACLELKDCLVLEINERRKANFRKLKQVLEPFLICLDDFGSGWNSMEAMLKLKPHFVKVDVKHTGELFPLMLKAVNLIAEKVETQEEFLRVRKHKVFLVQGRFLNNIFNSQAC